MGKGSYVASTTTVAVALIVLTPFCGFLFSCGCTWPWEGLHSHCNYFRVDETSPCPWCENKLLGVLSLGSAVLSAIWGVIQAHRRIELLSSLRLVTSCVVGLSILLLVAAITGGISAYLTHYLFYLAELLFFYQGDLL